MTLKECYQILKVDQTASLEDVKRAYRRRAFELHPDLNPHVKDASRQFQLLNEAYVIITRLVTAREAAEQRRQEQPQDQSFASRWNSWSFSFGGKKPESGESGANAKTESKAKNSEERRAEREEAYREEMRREEARRREEKIRTLREEEAKRERERQARKEQDDQAKQEKERQEQEQREKEKQEKERLENERLEKERQTIPPRPGSFSSSSSTERTENAAESSNATPPRPPRPGTEDNVHAEQQEVLRDILNDSFARRVFEDIYSEIRKKGPQPEHTEAPRPTAAQKKTRERTVLRPGAAASPPTAPPTAPPAASPKSGFSFSLDQFGLDFSKGMGNTVKGWLRSQIDEEQTIRLPATGLFPGARVRLQIRRGLSDELTTLEVVLPSDFMVGKPIRLRGMGKKLGSVQGDLYLTVLCR